MNHNHSDDAIAHPHQPAQDFIAKWRGRWPEWGIAEVFIPAAQRPPAAAWFALLDELTFAAWALEPAPGLAKLGWWQDELNGWDKGARRHPLGDVLLGQPLAWRTLATALNGLSVSRGHVHDSADAALDLVPLAQAVMDCEAILFAVEATSNPHDQRAALSDFVARHALLRADAATIARVLAARTAPAGATRPRRLHAAILTARLHRHLRGKSARPPPAWRSLFHAWRAARAR